MTSNLRKNHVYPHADLVTFTEEIFSGKLHFCAVYDMKTEILA